MRYVFDVETNGLLNSLSKIHCLVLINIDTEKVQYLTKDFIDKTPEGEVLDELKLTKYCCRRHMLTHVDIE